MAIKYDSNFVEGDFLPSSVVNNMIDSIKENETNINKKIDKVDGKGLSTNDYTDEEKQKNANNATDIEEINTSLSDYVKKTDYASASAAGVVRVNTGHGIVIGSGGNIMILRAVDTEIANRLEMYKPITPFNLNTAVKAALTDSKHISMTDDEQKTAADVLNVEYRKQIVTSSTETTDVAFVIPYVDGRSKFDAFYNYAVSRIQINIQPEVPAGYECSFSFQSGENATSMLYSSGAIRFVGIDCDADGDFIPSANTNYEVSIKNLSSTNTIDNRNLIARVGVF